MAKINYQANEERGERFILIVLDNDRGGDYAHIKAHVVREAVKDRINPDTGSKQYNDGENATGYRNCKWSSDKNNALYVEDLFINSQITKRSITGTEVPANEMKPYGVELRFKPYVVDASNARKMSDTFDKIGKKMEQYDEEFGYCNENLPAYILRVAKALGIKKFLTVPKDGNRNLDRGDYRVWNGTDVSYIVSSMIDELKPAKAE
jgi:hypothetical protein